MPRLDELFYPLSDEEKYLTPPKGLSKQQQLLWRIQNDSVWYAEKFLKIRNKDAKLIPFKFNDAQLIMERIDRYCKDNGILRRYIVLKARQMGISTYTEGKMFHDTATNEFKGTMIITQEDSATQNLFNMSKLYYDELPLWLKPMRKTSNERALTFENPTLNPEDKMNNPGLRSKYSVATANAVEVGRSFTIHNLHACLSGDSKVVLSDGSTKTMEDIAIGDLVLTSNGNVSPVTFKSCTGTKQTYKLDIWCSGEPIYATNNHKILTLEGYKELKDLKKNDYVAMPKITPNNEITKYSFHLDNIERKQGGGSKHIEDFEFDLNYNFGYLLGYYLAEGHVKENFGYLTFCYHKDEHYIDKALKGTFGLETSLKTKYINNKGITNVYGKFLTSAIESICGRVENKHIPNWFFKTNKDFLNGVLDGYLDGDGSKTQTRRVSYISIHEKIARQIRRIVFALELGAVSFRESKRQRYDKKTKNVFIGELNGDTWRRYNGNEVQKQHKATKYKIINGQVFCKVREITERKMELVYDIEVGNKDHNYETTSCIVSNSEVAFWAKPEITMTGLMQAIADNMDTLVILESTANGVGGYFYKMWQDAIRGDNDFIPIFLPWFTDKTYTREFKTSEEREKFFDLVNQSYINDRGEQINTYYYWLMHEFDLTIEQINWYDYTKRNKCQNDEDIMKQEYPSTPDEAFISTGRPVFNSRAIQKYTKHKKKPLRQGNLVVQGGEVQFVDDEKGFIKIWKEPARNEFYSIGADVAEGLINGDYSCAQVGDSNFDVVATWHGHIDPDLFGEELVKLAKYYNNAYIGCENNNHGLTTLHKIKLLEYWNIYYTKNYDKLTEKITQKMGWSTTPRTKPLMIDKLSEYIREMYLGIHDELTISELSTYVRADNGTTNAQIGCHDDTVMSLAILLQMMLEGRGNEYVPEQPFDEYTPKSARKEIEIIDPLFEEDKNIEFSE